MVISRDDRQEIRSWLPLPPLLVELIKNDRWIHPGHRVMRSKVAFIRDPLCFLPTREAMLFESGPLMGPKDSESEIFSEYRGSVVDHRDLPWIDVEQVLFVIVNERPGDDVGIALDYRTGLEAPRVVGGDWGSGDKCLYREIASSFESFVEMLAL